MPDRSTLDLLAFVGFCCSLVLLSFLYGMAAAKFRLFPYPYFNSAVTSFKQAVAEMRGNSDWYFPTAHSRRVPVFDQAAVFPGLNLVTSLRADKTQSIAIVDSSGALLHEWNPE